MAKTAPAVSPRASKHALILDAAQRRFAHYGFSKVTMDEIAHDVGLEKPSLYYYFPAKQDVIRGVVERELREFISELESSLNAPASASAKLRLYAEKRSSFFRKLVNLASLDEWSRWRPIIRDLFSDLASAEERLVVRIVRAGRQAGELDVPSPERTATLIVHLFHGLRMRLLRDQLPGAADGLQDELDREMMLCVDLLLKGMGRRV